jgi:stress-induced morphogen
MDASELEALIERELPDAEATVSTPRDPDDDKHYAVEVVSPAFAGKSLVDQHQLVHDALDGVLTEEIHAIELRTHTPDEG